MQLVFRVETIKQFNSIPVATRLTMERVKGDSGYPDSYTFVMKGPFELVFGLDDNTLSSDATEFIKYNDDCGSVLSIFKPQVLTELFEILKEMYNTVKAF